jgi:pyruvate kinase
MLSIGTKIVATLGPASREPKVLEGLIEAGIDVARLNFSHGTAAGHEATIESLRHAGRKLNRNVAILQDLQGPKVRVGRFPKGKIDLHTGEFFQLSSDERIGDERGASISHRGLPEEVEEGQILLLDDGNLRLRIIETHADRVDTVVEVGGVLSDGKGVNAPGADLSIPCLTPKDLEHIDIGVKMFVDWVALSFVRRPEDIIEARKQLRQRGSHAHLIAKIEKPGAVRRFSSILEVADGIMIARGDLGVEMPPEDVPQIQKRLIAECRRAGKPVITATQMLESMVEHPVPTRAEASDVANAIFDGTDAVMLSAETATGRYPIQAVEMIARIAHAAETSDEFADSMAARRPQPQLFTQDAISLASTRVAEGLPARAIVVFTSSGSSAWRVARYRPRVPVLALTPSVEVRDRLNLAYGIRPALAPNPRDSDSMVSLALEKARLEGLAEIGDLVVITAGVPFGVPGTTNMLRVEKVRGPLEGRRESAS